MQMNYGVMRRLVLGGVLLLFLLQFARIKVLVGGLTGSVALWFVNIIDVFSFFESVAASKSLALQAAHALLPALALYLVFGRAFCGWLCPMDFVFELTGRLRRWRGYGRQVPVRLGYYIAGGLLVLSAIIGVPVFARYLSHLTNFFRGLSSGVYLAMDVPVDPGVLIYSATAIVVLVAIDLIYPRLWCRVLCPVGKTYGLLNRVSLLTLKLSDRDCAGCTVCEDVCYMGVGIVKHLEEGGVRDVNCIYCGRCAESCEARGKLIKLGFEVRKKW